METAAGPCSIAVLAPHTLLAPLRKKLTADPTAEVGVGDPRWARQLEAGVTRTRVSVSAVLDQLPMTLAEIAALAVGQVLTCRGRAWARCAWNARGAKCSGASSGRPKGRYSLEIEEHIEPEDNSLESALAVNPPRSAAAVERSKKESLGHGRHHRTVGRSPGSRAGCGTRSRRCALGAARRHQRPAGPPRYETILSIPVTVQVVLGGTTMPVSSLMKLGRGAVVSLDQKVGDPVSVVVNGRIIARGEVVVVDEETARYGVSLTEIVAAPRDDRAA